MVLLKPDSPDTGRFRCIIGYEIKEDLGANNLPVGLNLPAMTYFGSDKKVFLYANQALSLSREVQFYLKKVHFTKHGNTYILSPEYSLFHKYIDLGFIFDIESTILELQYVHNGIFYQQITFDGSHLKKVSDALFRMLQFKYAKVKIEAFSPIQNSLDQNYMVLGPQNLKRYSILIDKVKQSKSKLPERVHGFQRYHSTDLKSRTLASGPDENFSDPGQNKEFDEFISEIPFITNFNKGCLEEGLPLYGLEFQLTGDSLTMSFSIPSDLCYLVNKVINESLGIPVTQKISLKCVTNHKF